MSNLIHVTSSPHVREKIDTGKIMLLVIISLLPATFTGIMNFGLRALIIIILSVASAVLSEWVYEKILHMESTIFEPVFYGTFFYTGTRKRICNHSCKDAVRRTGTEFHEPCPCSQMFPLDQFYPADDLVYL